jgi:UDP-3-O-[3-hydroxymyristoyl] glucosamine N-acyltransferase
MTGHTVSALARLVGGRVVGEDSRPITGIGDLQNAGPDQIGFVRDANWFAAARSCRAGALITSQELDVATTQILVDDVGAAFARVAQLFHPLPSVTEHLIDPSASVHPAAKLEDPVLVGPVAAIGRATIGQGSMIMHGAVVGDGCVLGKGCVIHPNVTLYPDVRLGDRVTIHAGTVVGSDGFGYAREGRTWIKIPQIGNVVIGDDVEIGSNCTVDRATMGATAIGPRTKIDNLVHLGHNVVIGADCIMAAGSMISGSVTIGDRVTVGGHVLMAGHLKVVSDTRLGGSTGLVRSVEEPGEYMGYPVMDKRQHLRLLQKLPELMELFERVEALERREKRD